VKGRPRQLTQLSAASRAGLAAGLGPRSVDNDEWFGFSVPWHGKPEPLWQTSLNGVIGTPGIKLDEVLFVRIDTISQNPAWCGRGV